MGRVCPGLLDLGYVCWVDALSLAMSKLVSEQGIASILDLPSTELLQRNIIIFSKDKQDGDTELISVLSFTENSSKSTRKS